MYEIASMCTGCCRNRTHRNNDNLDLGRTLTQGHAQPGFLRKHFSCFTDVTAICSMSFCAIICSKLLLESSFVHYDSYVFCNSDSNWLVAHPA